MAGFIQFRLNRDWKRTLRTYEKMPRVYQGARKKILRRIGERLKQKVRENIDRGGTGSKDLHPMTVESKGDSAPLIETGEMREAVRFRSRGDSVEVGWFGNRRAAIAASVSENGKVIRVTEGLRRMFAARGFPLRADTTTIFVPPRPFVGPAIRSLQREKSFWDKLSEEIDDEARKQGF